LTDAVHHELIKAIRAGCYANTAAQFAGISESTLYSWLEQGRADQAAGRSTVFSDWRLFGTPCSKCPDSGGFFAALAAS
jgi:hypothetical protein